ncbi:MAG: CHAP domain-containing protein [Sphingobacteriales bacterium]|nr:CHAP domain-containing protein [Sphingobacteriales bacterium]
MTRTNFIVEAAKWYLGRTEKKGNSGFNDSDFEKELKNAGWYVGAPWCAFFGNMVWIKHLKDNSKLYEIAKRLDSGSALQTFKNYQADSNFETGDKPKLGAKVIWTLGHGPSGHEGIVVEVNEKTNTMITVEGNTNNSGSREGDCVAMKPRTINRPFKEGGLNVVGYIYPVEY